MFTGLNSQKIMVAFMIILVATVIYVMFWFTNRKPEEREIYLSGSLYLEDRIDTLTALPSFEMLIRQTRPQLIIVDEFIAYSLDLLHMLDADSIPSWHDSVTGQFREKLNKLKDVMYFEVSSMRPWRLDILSARRTFLRKLPLESELTAGMFTYIAVHEAANEVFPADTLFNNPLFINTELFDATREMERSVFAKVFNDALAAGSFDTYHGRNLEQLKKILSQSAARRILIFCDPVYKFWYNRRITEITHSQVRQISRIRTKQD